MSSYCSYFSPTALRRLRVAQGLSRTELAAKIGVSQETLVAWETGRSGPRVESLGVLSVVLDCAIDALFCGVTKNDPAGMPGRSTTASGRTHDTA